MASTPIVKTKTGDIVHGSGGGAAVNRHANSLLTDDHRAVVVRELAEFLRHSSAGGGGDDGGGNHEALAEALTAHADTIADLGRAVQDYVPHAGLRQKLLGFTNQELPALVFATHSMLSMDDDTSTRAASAVEGGAGAVAGSKTQQQPGASPGGVDVGCGGSRGTGSGRTSPRLQHSNNNPALLTLSGRKTSRATETARREQLEILEIVCNDHDNPVAAISLPNRVTGRNFHLVMELPPQKSAECSAGAVSYTHLTLPTKRIV